MNHSGESTRAASGPRRVDRHHVVVVGAGFGGLAAAKSLAGLPVDVTVIDSRNHHTFQPLLYQVATAGLDGDDICFPVRGVFAGQDNVRVRLGTVTDVDIERAALRLGDGSTLGYDDLVLAAGAVTNPFGIPGVEEHAYGLKSLRDALALRSHVLMRFETADTDPVHLTDGTLTVVVAGGGPTGVELAGGLIELSTMVLRHDYPGLDLRSAGGAGGGRGSSPARLPPQSLGQGADTSRTGVEVMLNTAVSSVDATTVRLGDGSEIAAHTMVWTAGVRAHPLAETLGVELTKGARIVVGPDLSVPGYPRVHVVGDMAGATDSSGALLPQVAPVAMQSAEYVADKIRHRIHGESVQPFEYTDKGRWPRSGATTPWRNCREVSGCRGWWAGSPGSCSTW
ncbi:MAG: NAD(P)/FAD-dependent oxidoreductase [Microthrixaceae bacterium]